jgi:HlyD family secretion protein
MKSGNLDEGAAKGLSEADLPLRVREAETGTDPVPRSRWLKLALVVVLVAAAGVLLWSFRPQTPLATVSETASDDTVRPSGIAALGRLEPVGGVIAVTPPASSRNAVVTELRAGQGSAVQAGDILAVLETRTQAEAAVEEAGAEVALRLAEVARVRRTLEASKAEVEAQIALAQVQFTGAEQTLTRAARLVNSSTVTPARLEELQTSRDARAAELAQAEARRVQLAGAVDTHPDVIAAEAALASARAAQRRIEADLENTVVRAPAAGRIISVAIRVGEPAPSGGMLRLAVEGRSRAILEVHQDRVHLVHEGAPVSLRAAAFLGELTGVVETIGVEVQRQAVFASDPAANADARVFEVRVLLDEDSSAIARDLINLQVLAAIRTGVTP